MRTQLLLLFSPQNVDPIILYDSDSTNQILYQLTNVVNYPPTNAELIINSAADIKVIPSQRGRRLHVGATQPLIEAAIFSNNLRPEVEAFTQEVIPAITDEDLIPLHLQAQQLLQNSLTFGFNTAADAAEWRIDPDKLAAMLNIVETQDANGKPHLTLALDSKKLAPYFEEMAKTINLEPSNAKLNFDEEENKLVVIQPSRDGRMLDIEAVYDTAEPAIADAPYVIDVRVLITPSAISSNNIDSLGIKELVSQSTS